MTKTEELMGMGSIFALLSVPLSLWLDIPVLIPFTVAFAMGACFRLIWIHLSEKEEAGEALVWHMVGLRAAEECGWDKQAFKHKTDGYESELRSARHSVAGRTNNFGRSSRGRKKTSGRV